MHELEKTLPQFTHINIDTTEHDLKTLLDHNLTQIDTLLSQTPPFTWNNLMRPLENQDDALNQFWSPINHMHAVVNSPALRDVYNACIPLLSDYATKIGHNKKLFEAIQSIKQSDEYPSLDIAQQKVIDNELRDFHLAGVTLNTDKKKQFADLSKALSQLTTKFEENVLDATQGWTLHITDEKELSGIPQDTIDGAKATAESHDKTGWVFTLEIPDYLAVITYADSASMREHMYHAYCTRASDQGPTKGQWDNTPVMQAIMAKRLELAKLLDFNNYAEKSLATKMVKRPQDVLDFLEKLVSASLPVAKTEHQALRDFAQELHGVSTLNAWDLSYYTEKLRQHRYAISQEDCRPYFPEDNVVQGLFTVAHKLYGVTIKPLPDANVWHKDARCYALLDDQNQVQSVFYFDLYARENKRGGAWMDDYRSRRVLDNGNVQIPVAYVTCNFNGPVGDKPALFRHDDVVTLFHEFGHALQHMLTKVDYLPVSGINGVPWDAVEIASQFFENWAWEKESIQALSGHYKTGDPLPDDLFDKMLQAKNFQAALHMIRQLEFALFDFKLHMQFNPEQDNQIQTVLDTVRNTVGVIPVPAFNRFQHGFSHIFAGGYAAGYYSYKWAEVMAADAFSLFKENGIFDPATSSKFKSALLETGGAREPLDLFVEFRGHEPDINALLKQDGII